MEVHRNVIEELQWDPAVRHLAVDAAVADNVATLTGTVSCEAERRAAEEAARRVRGVRAVINCIEVIRPAVYTPPDAELAHLVDFSLRSCALLPAEGLQATVHDGCVTLTGQVPWRYQRVEAERVVSRLRGVAGIANLIDVAPAEAPVDVTQKVETALRRCAGLDAQWVTVEAYKGKVVLRGSVRSWQESALAQEVAARAPGVEEITNHLAILP
ncbi:MAG: BON domain-containing protein [Chloroflexi bacterium]|nr:BON domain-containing protein [Chloroflexota bacterium]